MLYVSSMLYSCSKYRYADAACSLKVIFGLIVIRRLRQSSFLFNRLGTSEAGGGSGLIGSNGSSRPAYDFIDSLVKVTGLNTGYSVDLPIRFVKLQ